MFKEVDPHPELRDLMSAELPGGGECVKIKSVSFLSRSLPKPYVPASYLKKIKIKTDSCTELRYV